MEARYVFLVYKLILAPGVSEQIKKLSPFLRQRIDEVFLELTANPYTCYDAMRMRGGSFTKYRCKTGDYRIIYTVNEDRVQVYVLKVGNRKDVYS
ncbi:type II toxin-antitoxin system RelE/ParE family toxin [Sporomusa paucivorans]|uniref:type II toxin-antitoxin system RelE family toxin n=1 Tax=Sporomusa paucivorans TaxID=2376 RepID=UPI003570AC45